MAKKVTNIIPNNLLNQLNKIAEFNNEKDGVNKPKGIKSSKVNNKDDKKKGIKAENDYGEVISYFSIDSISEYLNEHKENELSSLEDKLQLDNNQVPDKQIKMEFGTQNETQVDVSFNNPFTNPEVNLGAEEVVEKEIASETVFGQGGVFGLMSLDALNKQEGVLHTDTEQPVLTEQQQGVINQLRDGEDKGLHDLKLMKVSGVHYLEIINKVPNFISLDISVKSTGWVRKVGDRLDVGAYSITTKDKNDLLGRRDEFREFLLTLAGDEEYDFICIEDVIGSVNFNTARILYQLNPLADDLVSEGLIKAGKIYRKDNNYWKSVLKKLSNYKSPYRGYSNHKQIIRDSLYLIHFGDRTTDYIIEDMYDAMGLGVVCSYEHKAGTAKTKKALKTGYKSFNLKQFETHEEALEYANEQLGYILMKDCSDTKRTFEHEFKKLILEEESDNDIIYITIPTNRIGVPAIENNFNLDIEMSYIVARKKSRR